MAKDKTVTVELSVEPPISWAKELLDMEWQEFYKWAGGRLAVGLFEGKFQQTLTTIIDVATSRGKYAYHKQLLDQKKKP